MGETKPDARSGEILAGKYRIHRFIAAGGMAAVYEAQHLVVKRRFAVKILRPDFSQRREILARFLREAETAGALEGENIASAVDFGVADDGSPFIVMEYLVGAPLHALLARAQRLPMGRAADLCVQACRGVHAAHGAGIIHRDLKPQNLFVCRREDGTDLLKVLDFGVAKLQVGEGQSAVTRTGAVLGTPFYMAPEQARGDRDLDCRVDVYGLGAVLYELLSGQKPHPGESHNAVLHHIATQPALPLASIAPDLPAPLVAIVHRALEADPRDRFLSAKEVEEALAPLARREVWPEAHGDILPGSLDGQPAPALAPVSRPRGRRRWTLIGLLALAGGALLASIPLHRQRPQAFRFPSQRPLPPGTQFYTPQAPGGAIQQIASLAKSKAFKEAGELTAMTSTPFAVWFSGGSPGDVQAAVRDTIARAVHRQRVPILVAYNLPFRDCAEYSSGGAADSDAYRAWIDAFARGIGNEKAVVILEPDGVGIIPYNHTLSGVPERCKPTVTNARGDQVTAPGANPMERYALLNHAADTLASRAPGALVYLDGTHSGWLPAGEAAYRLVRAGVEKLRGFALNVANYQDTAQTIQYGTWISKCIYFAGQSSEGRGTPDRFRACAGPDLLNHPNDDGAKAAADDWYAANVDQAAEAVASRPGLAHFVIDTSRNGRGPLDVTPYALPPYNQPREVLDFLGTHSWCNPPSAGLGKPPTVDTGVALVDAFLWVISPGTSDGSCSIAGNARAWDYSRYNPWAIPGDAQKNFDPLWGMVDPGSHEWFPEKALQLIRNAHPSSSQ
jgi:endoglucanase